MRQIEVAFPDSVRFDKPIEISVSESEVPLEGVSAFVDDVYQGDTDIGGDIVVLIEREVKTFFHRGLRPELLLMVGYDHADRRRLVSAAIQRLFAYPFTQAGFDLGYYMHFLSNEE